MTLDIFTPLATSAIVELGNKLWRKQVLPFGSIDYEGRTLDFDETYLSEVVRGFAEHSHDTVPFVLAPDDNRHTMAAERGRFGEAVGFDVDLDAVDPDTGRPAPGLYSTLRLSKAAEDIVRENPRFGVSMRIKENYVRQPDKAFFRAAPQHVLGTWDPKVAGLSRWQAVDLSNDPGTAVLDLSGLTYTTKETDMPKGSTGDGTASTATDDTKPPAWFTDWLRSGAPGLAGVDTDPDDAADDAGVKAGDGTEGGTGADVDAAAEGELSDEEFQKQLVELFPDDVDEPQEVTASQTDPAVELANAARDERLQAVELSNRDLRRQLDAKQYAADRDQLARLSGLPPAVIDLARPLLEGAGRTVELANGSGTADAGEIVRQLLAKFGETVRLLDLSAEVGPGPEIDDEEEAAKARTNRADAFVSGLG